jgi:hypothetical protein
MQPPAYNPREELERIIRDVKGTRPQRKPATMTNTQEVITPQIAALYLQRNTQNRALREHRVREFQMHLKNGTFEFTHQGIAFDQNDTLIDGQHRLHAIVRENATVTMWVAKNAPRKTYIAIDDGGHRTLGNQLHATGIKNYNHLATLAKPLTSWVKAQELNVYTARGVSATAGNRGAATNHENIEFVTAYEAVLQQAQQAGLRYHRKDGLWTPGRMNMLYAMYYPIQGKNGGIKEFFDQVFLSINRDSVRSPASLLHQKLMNNFVAKRKGQAMRDELMFAYAVEAANLFFANQTRAKLSWSPDRPYPQPPVEALQFYSEKVKFAGEHAR